MSDPIRIFTRTGYPMNEAVEAFQARVNKTIQDEDLVIMNMQSFGNEKGYVTTIVVHVELTNQWIDDRTNGDRS